MDRPEGFVIHEPPSLPDHVLPAVHQRGLLAVYRAARLRREPSAFHPWGFPRRDVAPDPRNPHHLEYFCTDTCTPLDRATPAAVWGSAASAWAASKQVAEGGSPTHAWCRPPGHRASHATFGGSCCLNNAAVAVLALEPRVRIAILDIDVHHRDGTQALFWTDPLALVVSIHGEPNGSFPFVSGWPDERGEGPGRSATGNLVEAAGCDGHRDAKLLDAALETIRSFDPAILVLSAGVEAHELDPKGTFALSTEDFADVGEPIGGLDLPTVVVQEGGYHVGHLGRDVVTRLNGLCRGARGRS